MLLCKEDKIFYNLNKLINKLFTNEDNWRLLIEIKLELSDKSGIGAVIEDLFVILGRDPDRTNILNGIDLSMIRMF